MDYFDQLDTDGSGELSMQEITKKYDSSREKAMIEVIKIRTENAQERKTNTSHNQIRLVQHRRRNTKLKKAIEMI